ncbi:D-tagatose-bisphosphate aldolase, class II, non-catalytic subunit [Microvirga sp. W0021]|uniref:D-tagatose-bisphosphate aldolase, class II, non-catalytic subunit n=1 Tax=Hohaiivirga grylli TaxID=3133970 RepID=A0ABV0BER4_9HYPH
MHDNTLLALPKQHAKGIRNGLPSICSAHPLVIEAALRSGLENDTEVLIEATCNQVNQDGGYTGMTPADFRRFAEGIADKLGFDKSRLILGGDHLGPNPWKHLPANEALAKAATMMKAFVEAGFTKIHLDASMACADDPVALPPSIIAQRAADLAAIAEKSAGPVKPVYIIGTEVPIPGGAMEALDHLQVTRAEDAKETIELHRLAFSSRGLEEAFNRVIGLVVQPGVEYGHEDVIAFKPEEAKDLSAVLKDFPQIVFEAHSTDYQTLTGLSELVEDGFAILKVGPWLTFAMREALYGLDRIACELMDIPSVDTLEATMERVMLNLPKEWEKYYPGNATEQRILRHYSYSDRIRYYWPQPEAQKAFNRLMSNLEGKKIPETLISQFMAPVYQDVVSGKVEATPKELIIATIRKVVDTYARAARQI